MYGRELRGFRYSPTSAGNATGERVFSGDVVSYYQKYYIVISKHGGVGLNQVKLWALPADLSELPLIAPTKKSQPEKKLWVHPHLPYVRPVIFHY